MADFRDSIEAVTLYATGLPQKGFFIQQKNRTLFYRRLEKISEAADRLSDEFRNQYPKIPWHKIIGMRNVLIHEYDTIDLDLVWEEMQKDINEAQNGVQRT